MRMAGVWQVQPDHRTKFKYKAYFNSFEGYEVAAGERSLSNTGEEDTENKGAPGN